MAAKTYDLPKGMNLYIAKAEIGGVLVEDPIIKSPRGVGEHAILKIVTAETITNIKTKESRTNQVVHTVQCMRDKSVLVVKEFYRKGVFVWVEGKITYNEKGEMTILIDNQYGGIKMIDLNQYSGESTSSSEEKETKPNALGNLAAASSTGSSELDDFDGVSEGNTEKTDTKRSFDPPDDDEDDEIPF